MLGIAAATPPRLAAIERPYLAMSGALRAQASAQGIETFIVPPFDLAAATRLAAAFERWSGDRGQAMTLRVYRVLARCFETAAAAAGLRRARIPPLAALLAKANGTAPAAGNAWQPAALRAKAAYARSEADRDLRRLSKGEVPIQGPNFEQHRHRRGEIAVIDRGRTDERGRLLTGEDSGSQVYRFEEGTMTARLAKLGAIEPRHETAAQRYRQVWHLAKLGARVTGSYGDGGGGTDFAYRTPMSDMLIDHRRRLRDAQDALVPAGQALALTAPLHQLIECAVVDDEPAHVIGARIAGGCSRTRQRAGMRVILAGLEALAQHFGVDAGAGRRTRARYSTVAPLSGPERRALIVESLADPEALAAGLRAACEKIARRNERRSRERKARRRAGRKAA